MSPAGYIQILKCCTPVDAMCKSLHSEEDLDVDFNYVAVRGLLPADEFDLISDVYAWFDSCRDVLGWKHGLGDFDIINVIHVTGRLRAARSKAFMLITKDAYNACRWMQEEYREVSTISSVPDRTPLWAVALKHKIKLMNK